MDFKYSMYIVPKLLNYVYGMFETKIKIFC